MKKSLIALAFGTLGLGIAEFTMMGILPYVATDLGISIPVAVISFLRMRWVFVLVRPCCSWPVNAR